ncbi:unnamed protein product [Gongylonema pulchrum]|uniref:Uncharacterized protein n=1 Tax=Gongylonema pulchrum TaxID=637853 RepID=A0A183EE39_9BILA|nr:unnamed protein product [Gongylonema pulchrum]
MDRKNILFVIFFDDAQQQMFDDAADRIIAGYNPGSYDAWTTGQQMQFVLKNFNFLKNMMFIDVYEDLCRIISHFNFDFHCFNEFPFRNSTPQHSTQSLR